MSFIDKAIEMVNIENLYDHIRSLEGIRHPLNSMDALNKCGEYIKNKFENYGLNTQLQNFSVKGGEEPFFNVEGTITSENSENPYILVTSHFDTVYNAPGADDNASAIAVMLETARILKKMDYSENVACVSFNLEEGSFYLEKKLKDLGEKYGIFDEKNRQLTWVLKMVSQKYNNHIIKSQKLFLDENIWEEFKNDVKGNITQEQLQFYEEANELRKEIFIGDPYGETVLQGSGAYVKKALEKKMRIKGVINLESVGYTSLKPHSQSLPQGLTMDLFQNHNIDEELMVGNFICVISDEASEKLANSFFNNAKHKKIDLSCANLVVPMNYEAIRQNLPDLLRSDHAPFLRYGIPAIMVTDTANFRNPYYHTEGDTISTLDFPFIKKVCQTTLATVIGQVE